MDDQPLLPPAPSPSPFLSLPPELKQIIFSALPNASSLRSLVLTCSSFYRTFLDAETLIINSVLLTHIGSDLIFDAIVVSKSTTLEPCGSDAATELLELYAKQACTCLSPIQKLRDALVISSLHETIEIFSKEFASLALSTNPVTGLEDASPYPLSLLESNRVKRTFYRYELFCNMFRERGGIENAQTERKNPRNVSVFFSMCAPWENEQLACVRDYLSERLSLRMCYQNFCPWENQLMDSAFNDMAEHDVEWAELETFYLNDCHVRCDYWKEHYLSLGLAYLRQVVNTSLYDDRCRLFKGRREDADYSCFEALTTQGHSNDLLELRNYTEEDEHIHIPGQLAIDADKGPEEAWRWANADNDYSSWYNIDEQASLRQRGYVMWDSARLIRWGLLDHEWDELPPLIVGNEEQLRRDYEMRESIEARHEIWQRGGRGWWSAGDESRLIWLPPPPPKRPATMAPKVCWGNRKVWATDMETWRENL